MRIEQLAEGVVLYNADCREILPTLGKVDAVVTDPPYGINYGKLMEGKGDGNAEFVLGSGQDVTVIRDADGRPAVSELATGLVTDPQYIPYESLIAGRFCTNDASCQSFVNTRGCYGHYSWTVTFQRNY